MVVIIPGTLSAVIILSRSLIAWGWGLRALLRGRSHMARIIHQ